MNKILVGISLLIVLVSFQFTTGNTIKHPNQHIQLDVLKRASFFEEQANQFLKIVQFQKVDQYFAQYKKTRAAYKGIETYTMFRYPSLDKAINGGPVPSITKDVVILHKDEPTGLQVIEELLAEEKIDHKNLVVQLKSLQKNAIQIKTSIFDLDLQNWEILEANHLAITKLITLGLSGFDSPIYLQSIPDALVVLKHLQSDLSFFKELANSSFDYKSFENQLKQSITFLTDKNFESLNRYIYYRDYLLPLQAQIKKLHVSTGYETYREVSTIKRSIANGAHLFSKDYLDPFYSIRGNVTSHNQDQIDLGKTLFFDPILSKNNKRACASCHSPDKAFSDGLSTSMAFDLKGNIKRNSPTLINSCFQNNFFWDLRSSDMNDQIMNVILSENEFNTTPEEIVGKLKQSTAYQELFDRAFYSHDQPISIGTVKSSIEIYVRSLVSINSKFDQNIRGNQVDLTPEEITGANLFLGKAACATCHFPPHFNGFVPPHYNDTEGEIIGTTTNGNSNTLDRDFGLYDRFRNSYPEARYVKGMFKTPSLRNIEYTAPYMHNGKFETLEEVVNFYNNGGGKGKGIDFPQQTLSSDSLLLSKNDLNALIAFMKTLSDTTSTHTNPFNLPKFDNDSLNLRRWGGEC